MQQVEEMRKKKARDADRQRQREKKYTKKLPKNRLEARKLEQSSLYEDPQAEPVSISSSGTTLMQTKLTQQAPKRKVERKAESDHSDKENTGVSVRESGRDSRGDKGNNSTINRTYSRKLLGNKTSESTFDSSDKSRRSPRKHSKKEKAAETWAQMQTSHFSEVEDFDLTFD